MGFGRNACIGQTPGSACARLSSSSPRLGPTGEEVEASIGPRMASGDAKRPRSPHLFTSRLCDQVRARRQRLDVRRPRVRLMRSPSSSSFRRITENVASNKFSPRTSRDSRAPATGVPWYSDQAPGNGLYSILTVSVRYRAASFRVEILADAGCSILSVAASSHESLT